MAEIIGNSTTNEVPSTQEQYNVVRRSNKHIHCFGMPVTKIGFTTLKIEDLLANWLNRKGAVYFVSMEVKVKFTAGGGELWIAWIDAGCSITETSELVTHVNRKVFASTDMDYSREHSEILEIPEGLTSQIYPKTGALPQTSLVINNAKGVGAMVSIFLTVDPTGPFVYRYTINPDTGKVTAMGGF